MDNQAIMDSRAIQQRINSIAAMNHSKLMEQNVKDLRGVGVAADHRIKQMVEAFDMITPFIGGLVTEGVISYGLSSFGYDLRVADEFQVFGVPLDKQGIVDPKNFDRNLLRKHTGDVCIIPPNSFALARSVEYIKMPRHVMALCLGKSTYARCGIICNFTPFEPEWEGFVTIEISNTTPLPAMIYANEGIAQVLFFEGEDPAVSYADRKGKYQKQTGIVAPKI